MELNERIALARKQAGLSQEQLGDKLGVSRQAVSKWESGQTNPDVAYVVGMCRYLGVSTDWLLTEEDSSSDAQPLRCPGCTSIITPLDDFCSKCGRSLRGKEAVTYTLLLQARPYGNTTMAAQSMVQLSTKKYLWSENSPMLKLDDKSASALIASAPQILDRGRTADQAHKIMETFAISDIVDLYRDNDGLTAEEFSTTPPLSMDDLPSGPATNSLSFGGTVLAVVVGLVVGLLLLSFL